MTKFLELHIRNFFSYGNNLTKISLDFTEPTLIIGENHDVIVDGEYDNNGTGKSSILNALSYCVYNKPVSTNIKVDDLINNINKKNLYVATILESDGVYYKIERWRKNSKLGGTGVRIISGDSLAALDDPANEKTPASRTVDEFIAEAIMKMPFEIFVRIVVFSARYEAFLSLPVTHTTKPSQTSILEELFGQTELTEKAVKLKERIKVTNADIKQLKELNERIDQETERYNQQLEMARESIGEWNARRDEAVSKLKDEIKELEEIDFTAEIEKLETRKQLREALSTERSKLDKVLGLIDTYQKNVLAAKRWGEKNDEDIKRGKADLVKYDGIDFDGEEQTLTEIVNIDKLVSDAKSERQKLDQKIGVLLKDIKELDANIKTLKDSKCPYCEQEFHDDIKIREEESKLFALAEDYSESTNHIEQIDSQLEECSASRDRLKPRFKSLIEFNNAKNEYNNLKSRIERIKSETNPYAELIEDDSVRTQWDADKAEHSAKIAEIESELESIAVNYADDFLYSGQTRLKDLKSRLVEKVKEENPHEQAAERLTRVFDAIDAPRKEELDDLVVTLRHQDFLLKLLTKKDSFIRQALLDANLPLLNTRLRHYLDIIGLPHRVEFTKDMTISISMFNNAINYANLSGGQQARINIAIAFSFRDVMQARYQKINLCILDECLDTGLSNLGVKLASKMIKQIAKENDLSMYIITHRDEIKASFNRKLKSVLKGGLTTLEYD